MSLDQKLTNYFDLLPEELILIIIGYVDISNKKGNIKLMKQLNGFGSLSIINNNIYNKYMKFIEDGIINNFKQIIYTYNKENYFY